MIGKNAPLQVNGTSVWKGQDLTNGFVMRNADGRIPALKQSFTRLLCTDMTFLGNISNTVPFGAGLFRELTTIKESQGTLYCGKTPTNHALAGVLEFNQGWVTGRPVVGIKGIPTYGKGEIVSSGLVGYKQAVSMDTKNIDDYIKWLKEPAKAEFNLATHRSTYDEWITALSSAGDNARLALFIHVESGMPILQVVVPNTNIYRDNDYAFAGFVKVFEPENKAVFVDIDTTTVSPMIKLA